MAKEVLPEDYKTFVKITIINTVNIVVFSKKKCVRTQ